MNSILKVGARACMSSFVKPTKSIIPVIGKSTSLRPAFTRTIWHMCSSSSIGTDEFLKPKSMTQCCQCGCSGLLHTKGEKELADFLKDEIQAERSAGKVKSLPKELDGFKIKTDGAEMTLVKENQLETITINFNINDSVVSDAEPEVNPKDDSVNTGDITSKPSFRVDLTRKGKTVSFNCSFVESEEPNEDSYNDVFGIDEVAYLEGEWTEKTYAVSGDVLDGHMYDLFMTLLEERGISNDFADKLADLATSFEHLRYIDLLENLKKFATAN